MTAKTAAKADAYRLQRITTPEDLEMKMMHNGGVVITYGDRILIAGYYYNPNLPMPQLLRKENPND